MVEKNTTLKADSKRYTIKIYNENIKTSGGSC